MDLLKGLSLFSGIGGIDLALNEWVRPLAYCEIDPYCQSVLLSRMQEGNLPKAPIWDDIRTLSLNSSSDESSIDIIYGGFPCQDISIAGLGKGLEGERSGLVYEIFRLAKNLRPSFIFLENVPAITARGGVVLVKEITTMGYDCRWCTISAASIGAHHKRERWFLLGYTMRTGLERFRDGTFEIKSEQFNIASNGENVSDTRCFAEGGTEEPEWAYDNITGCYRIWETEPKLDRVVDGVQNRVDRIKALGNSVVPQQAREAFKLLIGLS